MPDKRDLSRRHRRLQLKYGVEKEPEHGGFTDDLSDSGLFIRTSRTYPPGTKLYIDLYDPDEHIIRIYGIVMWNKSVPPGLLRSVKKGGMGIKIMTITSGKEFYNALLVSKGL